MPCCACCWNTRLRNLRYKRLGGQAIGSDAYAVLDTVDVDQILEERQQAGKPPHQYTLDGYSYRGEQLDGLKHGYGIMQFPNGDVYEGEWYNDTMEGRGLLKLVGGGSYDGFFRNGMAHGSGVYCGPAPDPQRFDGEYHFGLRSGDGALHCSNGDTVKCFYQLGAQCSDADITFANGDEYSGAIQEGLAHGKGKFRPSGAPAGDHLECSWVRGLPHGPGTKVVEGVPYDVEYDEGVCIRMQPRAEALTATPPPQSPVATPPPPPISPPQQRGPTPPPSLPPSSPAPPEADG